MAKTMKKDDVVYRAKLMAFDPTQIKEISGKTPTSAITVAIKDLKKAKKSGDVKDPELKIGKIDAHLYLRLKDGKTHIDDFLLAKNWTAPPDPDAGPVRDANYRRLVAEYIQTRKDAHDDIVAGEKEIKRLLGVVQQKLAQVQGLIPVAKAGGFGDNHPSDMAGAALHAAIATATEAKAIFDADVHPPFDYHRSFKKPDELDIDDVDQYGRSYYLSQMRPKYGKAVEYVKLCNTVVGQIRSAAKNVRNFADHADQQEANYRSMAGELATQAETEVADTQGVWGIQPVEDVARAVNSDADKIVGLRTQDGLAQSDAEKLTARYLSTSNERMVALKGSYSRMKKHLQLMDGIVARLKTIPKPMQKDNQVKASIKKIATAQKAQRTYAKTVDGHVKEAMTAYGRVKKEAAS